MGSAKDLIEGSVTDPNVRFAKDPSKGSKQRSINTEKICVHLPKSTNINIIMIYNQFVCFEWLVLTLIEIKCQARNHEHVQFVIVPVLEILASICTGYMELMVNKERLLL